MKSSPHKPVAPPRPIWAYLAVLFAVLLAAILLRLLVHRDLSGAVSLGWPELDSIRNLRLGAILVAVLAGSSLGGSGVLLQSLLRNPLASPFILGLSSGAALGVMVSIFVATTSGIGWGDAGHTLPAVIGALTVLGIVFALGQRRGGLDPLTLLLVGVVVSAICNALIMAMQHLVPYGTRADLLVWMTGHIREAPDAALCQVTGAVAVIGLTVSVFIGRSMDVAALSDDEARSVGLRLKRLRIIQFTIAGALAAGAVALTGPIGFIGLIAPHAARLVLGPRHAPLVIGAAFTGATMLLLADSLTQLLPVMGGRLPVGVFTALAGGPAFIVLLRSGRGS